MMLAIRNLFTADYGDHGDWTYGRRTLRVEDQIDKIVCAIAWNPPSPSAATAVLALQAKCDLPKDLIQYASEYVNGYYAKLVKRTRLDEVQSVSTSCQENTNYQSEP